MSQGSETGLGDGREEAVMRESGGISTGLQCARVGGVWGQGCTTQDPHICSLWELLSGGTLTQMGKVSEELCTQFSKRCPGKAIVQIQMEIRHSQIQPQLSISWVSHFNTHLLSQLNTYLLSLYYMSREEPRSWLHWGSWPRKFSRKSSLGFNGNMTPKGDLVEKWKKKI